MRAILLAAGGGLRLQQPDDQHAPKCLLRFGGVTLLERHLRLLRSVGFDDVVLGLGLRHEHVDAELDRLGRRPRPAAVLYDARIARALVAGGEPVNRVLIDREFEPGDEPVKVCVKGGVPLELRKKPDPGLEFDTIGESVGFFRLTATGVRRLAEIVARYVSRGQGHLPHEEAVRDLIRERRVPIEVADVTGAPWIEIDFPADVVRAGESILHQLRPLDGP